jgi:cold shock CspA family protein
VKLGFVASFDAHSGLGEIAEADGAVVPFHCIAIADGSRHIDVGVSVRFVLLPKLGRYEAWAIEPV